MKKETLIEIILGTIGGLVFAIGMCLCLVPEWNQMATGIVVGVIGFLILLSIIPVYRTHHPKVKSNPINFRIVITWIIGVVGALVMGFGMSKVMIEGASSNDFIIGLISGIIGLIICILNYPIYAYINNK